VARQLRALGFDARALAGGYNAWRRAYDVEPTAPSAFVLTLSTQQSLAEVRDALQHGIAILRAGHPLWQRVRQAARTLGRQLTEWRRDE
jgi:hypothetical protein